MTVTKQMTVRVWVTDVWDAVPLDVTPETTLGQVKAEALKRTLDRPAEPGDYVIKFRGAALDESQTMAALSVRDQSPFIVLPARRQPVR